MKYIISILTLCIGIVINADAQTFTQRIQQKKSGQGTVTIHQDAAIDQLVNTTVLGTNKPAVTTPTPKNNGSHPATVGQNGTPATTHTTPVDTDGQEEPTVKVTHSGTKVTGYRVQVYAGYNREGKQTAERTRNNLRSQYPNLAIYVNFFNPRWVCRVGNYRTYEEAHQMLVTLRNMGYSEASIVKGKITVAY